MMRRTKRHNGGFTLTEMLLTVAILVVLFGLAMVPITKLRRELRQSELDGKAEIIFMAAQNRLTQLRAAGQSEEYTTGVRQLGVIPRDADTEAGDYTGLCYITSRDAAADSILPEGQVDGELRAADWVVEFDPESGSVYAVFYSEEGMNYRPEDFNGLRYRSQRLKNGATVGYYGGDSVGALVTGDLEPEVEVVNGERLLLNISCAMQGGEPLHFYVTIKDEYGNSTGELELKRSGELTPGSTYRGTMVLDDLTEGADMRFCQQERFSMLVPGADLTITVRVTSESNQVDEARVTRTTNSLFDRVSDGAAGRTAAIACGRHLQNLDQGSGVNDVRATKQVVKAAQVKDIRFEDAENEEDWSSCYPDQTFRPIRNTVLKEYDSTTTAAGTTYHPVISGLTVEASGDAGLFESIRGGALRSITLIDARITGSGYVGALAGTTSGTVTIESCQVYLASPVRGSLTGADDAWIRGATVGGLVGQANSGTLNISGSSASSVIAGQRNAGGLLGFSRGGLVNIQRSYADCYLFASTANGRAGGLIGSCYGTSIIYINSCYTAGFLSGAATAGLVAGELSGGVLRYSYTACAPYEEDGRLTYSTAEVGENTATLPIVEGAYYLDGGASNMEGTTPVNYKNWSGEKRAEAAALLGDAFTSETGGSSTAAYNLMPNMGLNAYSYPKLKGLTHYGDWKAEFESGSLVYYEKYQDGTSESYGFFGGNLSVQYNETLPLLGDGYGVVYQDDLPGDVSVTDEAGTVYRLTDVITIQDGEHTYYLLPLPDELVNPVPGAQFYRELVVGSQNYYYAPHFAGTVQAGEQRPEPPTQVPVRTARQLYALSLYYEKYKVLLPAGAQFQQGRDIDYTVYDWADYGLNGAAVSIQQSIGTGANAPFAHVYDGSCRIITGISFRSGEGTYCAGMFGYNAGALRNIVLADSATRTAELADTASGQTAAVGALAGWNAGTIYNCAVSGYELACNAYSGSTYYAGGLVGFNAGVIRASSVSSRGIRANSNYATLRVGGFVGSNRGQIRQSYAMGVVECPVIRGGGVAIGGFAAENHGVIQTSYCAVALSAVEGANVWGFASDASSVTRCYYLNGGSYSYLGSVYPYDYDGVKGATPVTDEELAALRLAGFGTVDAAHTFYRDQTPAEAGNAYPYRSAVADGSGRPVHYGDWITKADLGTVGVVYWEYEAGGANAGYHFSFIGFDESRYKEGSSLCTAHDDGGVIEAYGYGYYYKAGQPPAQLVEASVEYGNFVLGSQNTEAQAMLEAQVPGFTFVLYQTGTAAKAEGDRDGMRLESARSANGQWVLEQGGIRYVYAICPFFADAYSYVGDGTSSNTGVVPGVDKAYEVRSVEQLQFINWSYTNGVGSVDSDVTNSNYRTFPYLQYATVTGSGYQNEADALAGDSVGGPRPIQTWEQTHDINGTGLSPTEPSEDGEEPAAWESNALVHPIAGAVNRRSRNSSDSYAVILYNWFGGVYDGQNYYIKNIRIDSYCYNVGLFGTAVGAEIRNIVLYSDNDSVIQRSSERTSWDRLNNNRETDPKKYATSYALGGLVGIAYEYDAGASATIQNCSIAGYTIQDNSQNKLALGEAVVGGLLGVSSVNLMNCSAVVNIEINCTHFWEELKPVDEEQRDEMNAARWGNFIRVGGLVGGLHDRATNCYTGGKITVSDATLGEMNASSDGTNTVLCDGTTKEKVKTGSDDNNGDRNPSTHVFVGGVGGSGFSASFINFTANSESGDGKPHYENCYTYISLPDMKGTINGIAMIGSAADRFSQAKAQVELINCYYLKGITDKVDFSGAAKTYSYITVRLNGQVARQYNSTPLYDYFNDQISGADRQEKMLTGHMAYAGECLWNNGANAAVSGLTGLTYDQMSNRTGGEDFIQTANGSSAVYRTFLEALNQNKDNENAAKDGFGWVTIEENGGAAINGKYSFPGSEAVLLGQNYPFPTVLTQTDTFGDTVNLHYGTWPKVGLFWERGIATLDMLTDYDADTGLSSITLVLKPQYVTLPAGEEPTFQYSAEGIVEAEAQPDGAGGFRVRLKGLKTGSTEVTASCGGYTARLLLTVTADMSVTADPGYLLRHVGKESAIELTARDGDGNTLSGVTWQVSNENPDVASFALKNSTLTVKGLTAGEASLRITATLKLGGDRGYQADAIVTVTVVEPTVLGIANSSGGTTTEYRQGVANEELSAWESEPRTVAFENDAPDCGSVLFLYAAGYNSGLENFRVKELLVLEGTQSTDVLADQSRFTVLVGEAESNGIYSYRPLKAYGEAGRIELQVTLEDVREGGTFTLTIPYTVDGKMHVTFLNEDGGELAVRELAYGGSLGTSLPDAPAAEEGYVFTGWADEEGDLLTADRSFRRDTVFTPVFKKLHTISFATGEGTAVGPVQVIDGESTLLLGTVRTGYEFRGWTATDLAGDRLYAGDRLWPTGDLLLNAVWRKTQVTVRIELAGGTGNATTRTVTVPDGDLTIDGLNRRYATSAVNVYVDNVLLTADQYTRGRSGIWAYVTIYASALPGEEISE